jgi:hypothetical protein
MPFCVASTSDREARLPGTLPHVCSLPQRGVKDVPVPWLRAGEESTREQSSCVYVAWPWGAESLRTVFTDETEWQPSLPRSSGECQREPGSLGGESEPGDQE